MDWWAKKRAEDPEFVKQYQRDYRIKKKEKTPEYYSARQRDYYAENRERILEQQREYKKNNKAPRIARTPLTYTELRERKFMYQHKHNERRKANAIVNKEIQEEKRKQALILLYFPERASASTIVGSASQN